MTTVRTDIYVASRPFISVVMPVYNRSEFLKESIESILAQSWRHFEFIIVDDGSTDASREIIEAYATQDRRIRPLYLEHRGVAMAMNTGVELSRGDWIARMDSDDVALPERLALSIELAEKRGLDVCGGQVIAFGGNGVPLWFPEEHDSICRELLFRCPVIYPAAIVRKEILQKYPHSPGAVMEEYELLSRLASRYRLGNSSNPLIRYRIHNAQTTIKSKLQVKKVFQKNRFRLFYEFYPHTPLVDYLTLARLSDRLPLDSIIELKRAGQWLAKLADSTDRRLRERMAQRWLEACDCSVLSDKETEEIGRFFHMKILGDGNR